MLKALLNHDNLDPARERELFDQYHDGSIEARNEIMIHYLRLMIYWVNRALCSINREDDHFMKDDLFGAACLGAIRAIEKFDPEKGFQLNTYMSYWIRQFVNVELNIRRTISLPMDALNLTRQRAMGNNPTYRHLTDDIHDSVKRVLSGVRSLDVFQYGNQAVATNHATELVELREIVTILEQEDPLLYDILRYRFGLCDTPVLTLAEVAEKYNRSREWVRLKEVAAINWLREQYGLMQESA